MLFYPTTKATARAQMCSPGSHTMSTLAAGGQRSFCASPLEEPAAPPNRRESEQTPGDGEGQGSPGRCSPQGHNQSDTTARLNNNKTEWPPFHIFWKQTSVQNNLIHCAALQFVHKRKFSLDKSPGASFKIWSPSFPAGQVASRLTAQQMLRVPAVWEGSQPLGVEKVLRRPGCRQVPQVDLF